MEILSDKFGNVILFHKKLAISVDSLGINKVLGSDFFLGGGGRQVGGRNFGSRGLVLNEKHFSFVHAVLFRVLFSFEV